MNAVILTDDAVIPIHTCDTRVRVGACVTCLADVLVEIATHDYDVFCPHCGSKVGRYIPFARATHAGTVVHARKASDGES